MLAIILPILYEGLISLQKQIETKEFLPSTSEELQVWDTTSVRFDGAKCQPSWLFLLTYSPFFLIHTHTQQTNHVHLLIRIPPKENHPSAFTTFVKFRLLCTKIKEVPFLKKIACLLKYILWSIQSIFRK